jgi:hypothetical protein
VSGGRAPVVESEPNGLSSHDRVRATQTRAQPGRSSAALRAVRRRLIACFVRPHTRAMDPLTLHRLPRRVFFAFVSAAVIGVIVAIAIFSAGFVPPRETAGLIWVILPLYLGVLLAALALSFVVSGNTLMHHYRTGTVQRATEPTWFWWIVKVQSLIAVVLLVIGCVQWIRLYGWAA